LPLSEHKCVDADVEQKKGKFVASRCESLGAKYIKMRLEAGLRQSAGPDSLQGQNTQALYILRLLQVIILAVYPFPAADIIRTKKKIPAAGICLSKPTIPGNRYYNNQKENPSSRHLYTTPGSH